MSENSCIISVHLSSEERERVKNKAKELDMTVSGYVRKCLKYDIHGEDPEYLKEHEMIKLSTFADKLQISITRAKKICASREIAFYRIDGDYRILKSDFDKYLESVKTEKEEKEKHMGTMYTVNEVANIYKVTPQTIDRWIKDELMPCIRIGPNGTRIRILEKDLGVMRDTYNLNDIKIQN